MPPKNDASKSSDDVIQQCLAQMKEMSSQLEHVTLQNTTLQMELTALKSQVANSSNGSPGHSHSPFTPSSLVPLGPKAAKNTLSSFDGSNPLDWIIQEDQYFTLIQTPTNQQMTLVSFFMTGTALSWFKWLSSSQQLTLWNAFTTLLEQCFGLPSFKNREASLYKLHQTDTVMAYQQEFEKLSNRVVRISSSSLLNCFLSSLRDDIYHELTILRPKTLPDAISLAKLVEAKISTSKATPKFPKTPPTTTTAKPSILGPTPKQPPFPIRKLSPAEMQARRDKGLWFNCDDKFQPGYRCQKKQFLLLLSNDPPEPPPITPTASVTASTVEEATPEP